MTELAEDVLEEAERLTRLARDAADENAADAYRDRRDELLDDRGFEARVRESDDTLVCYPEEWIDDEGTVRLGDVEDTDRAAEVSLRGPGEQGDYEAAAERNAELVERVRERHGDVHGDNAAAFADFMNNHYARPMETAGDHEREAFLEEYFPRNAWPSEEQRDAVERSLELVFELADESRAATDSDTAPDAH
ncbi:MAG: rnhA operon protein [Halobacterium sp.]